VVRSLRERGLRGTVAKISEKLKGEKQSRQIWMRV
jgi:hypothetical protein